MLPWQICVYVSDKIIILGTVTSLIPSILQSDCLDFFQLFEFEKISLTLAEIFEAPVAGPKLACT